MRIIDADKFLAYLIFSKHIDGLTCGEVKEAIEMSKVDVLDQIRAEIEERKLNSGGEPNRALAFNVCLKIIDKYKAESEDKE